MTLRGRVWCAVVCSACGSTPTPEAPAELVAPTGAAVAPVPTPYKGWPLADARPARNALLIVLDTTRDDITRAAATPALDTLAEQGARAERSWAGGTWTVPSVVSLLTGRFVRHHGWDHPSARMGKYPPLPDVPRLATVLKDNGVETVGLYANPYLSEPLGFDQGFDLWRRTSDKQMAKTLKGHITKEWTMADRHFAYVHVLGPHSPLRPTEAARARWKVDDHWFEGKHGFMVGAAKRNQEDGVRAAYKAAYHAAVEDTDALVANILDALGPHRADTLVVVTSDHGELLGEHGHAGHGWWLYEELTHVPFIVDHPGIPGPAEALPPVVSNVVTADVITRGMGISADWPVTLADAPLLAARRDGREAVAFDGEHKVVWDDRLIGTAPVLVDLADDPDEAHPVAATDADLAPHAAFVARFPEGAVGSEGNTAVDPERAEELKVLGYVDE